jgi:hypothetical protein
MFYFNSTLKFSSLPSNTRRKKALTTFKTPKKYSFDEIMSMNNNKKPASKKYSKVEIKFNNFQSATRINRRDFDSIFDVKQEIEAKRSTEMIRSNLPNVLHMPQKKFQHIVDLNKIHSTNIENIAVLNSIKKDSKGSIAVVQSTSTETKKLTIKNQPEMPKEVVVYKKEPIKNLPEIIPKETASTSELSNTIDLRTRHVQFSPEPSIILFEKLNMTGVDQRTTSALNQVEIKALDKESFAYYSQQITFRQLKLIDEKNLKYTSLINKYESKENI